MVQRSQSTHSKRSNASTLPSVRERRENAESIYVNSDIIREFIAEETTQGTPILEIGNCLLITSLLTLVEESSDHYRPQSAAAVLHGKRHVCEIKIGGGTAKEEVKVCPKITKRAKRLQYQKRCWFFHLEKG